MLEHHTQARKILCSSINEQVLILQQFKVACSSKPEFVLEQHHPDFKITVYENHESSNRLNFLLIITDYDYQMLLINLFMSFRLFSLKLPTDLNKAISHVRGIK